MSFDGELMGSRGGNLKSLRRRYIIDALGQADPEEYAVAEALSIAPSTIDELVISDVELEENDEIQDQFNVTVVYGQLDASDPPSTGTMEYRFNFQAQGGHFNKSLETISASNANGTNANPATIFAPDFNGALNVVNDAGRNRAEGFQIDPPPETFTLAYYPENAVVSSAYQQTVAGICGTVNNATYRGYSAGSLMLVRCSGGIRTNESWSIEFGFAYVPNQTSIAVGNFTVAAKDGMDLLWVYFGPASDAPAKQLVHLPRAAYVERVWQRSNFSDLLLPA